MVTIFRAVIFFMAIMAAFFSVFGGQKTSKSGSDHTDHAATRSHEHSADSAKVAASDGKRDLVPQTTCPVMNSPIDKKQYVDFDGKRIYICCEGCRAQVENDPATYIKKLESMGQSVEIIAVNKDAAAEQKLSPQKTCPVMGNRVDKNLYVDYKGNRIYVCCPACVHQVKRDPDKYLKKLADLGEKPGSI
jgi:YHS domain-containing protein